MAEQAKAAQSFDQGFFAPVHIRFLPAAGAASCQDQPMGGTVAEGAPRRAPRRPSRTEPQESQFGDAVLDAMRGALRILGGMVQVAAGMTRLLAVAALKAAEAAEKVVEATEEEEEKPEPKPKR
jgi:hypothetical protein